MASKVFSGVSPKIRKIFENLNEKGIIQYGSEIFQLDLENEFKFKYNDNPDKYELYVRSLKEYMLMKCFFTSQRDCSDHGLRILPEGMAHIKHGLYLTEKYVKGIFKTQWVLKGQDTSKFNDEEKIAYLNACNASARITHAIQNTKMLEIIM